MKLLSAMTFFLIGIVVSNFINSQIFIFILGVYVTVAFFYYYTIRDEKKKKATIPAKD